MPVRGEGGYAVYLSGNLSPLLFSSLLSDPISLPSFRIWILFLGLLGLGFRLLGFSGSRFLFGGVFREDCEQILKSALDGLDFGALNASC